MNVPPEVIRRISLETYVDCLNVGRGAFKLMSAESWREDGIHTAQQLDDYLIMEAFSDTHKAAYGFRPRHYEWDRCTPEEAYQGLYWAQQELNAQYEEEARAQAARKRKHRKVWRQTHPKMGAMPALQQLKRQMGV